MSFFGLIFLRFFGVMAVAVVLVDVMGVVFGFEGTEGEVSFLGGDRTDLFDLITKTSSSSLVIAFFLTSLVKWVFCFLFVLASESDEDEESDDEESEDEESEDDESESEKDEEEDDEESDDDESESDDEESSIFFFFFVIVFFFATLFVSSLFGALPLFSLSRIRVSFGVSFTKVLLLDLLLGSD